MKFLIIMILSSLVGLQAGTYSFDAVQKDDQKRDLVIDMSQFVSTNITRKGAPIITPGNCNETKNIFRSDKKVVLSSNNFGSHPITLKIFNREGIVTFTQTKEKNKTSKFEIPVDKLENGNKLKVIDVSGNLQFCVNVKIVEQNFIKKVK